MKKDRRRGLTLIELTVVIALMGFLLATYFLAANPAGQLAASRNSERALQLQALMNAVRQNIADSPNGQFVCAVSGPLPTSSKRMASAVSPGNYNIAPCIVPNYGLFVLPFDPSAPGAHYASAADYDTAYSISINASSVITIAAPYAELGKTVSVSR